MPALLLHRILVPYVKWW